MAPYTPMPYSMTGQHPWADRTPWAQGATQTTADLAGQLTKGQGFTANGNPTYQGAYNPMYHAAEGEKITLKDLASLRYKSKGQGVIGDNPHPFRAANVYRKELGDALGNSGMDPFGFNETLPESPEEAKKKLQSQIALAGGDRQAVMDMYTGQVQDRQLKETAEKTGLTKEEAAGLTGAAAAKSAPADDERFVMGQWMQHYIDPYIAQEQAQLQFQADMFDQVAAAIIPTMDPNKAEIMKAYMPLISAAYHQKANSFATDFLSGSGKNSLMMQLLRQQKQQSSAINFLDKQSGGGTGDYGSMLQGIFNQS